MLAVFKPGSLLNGFNNDITIKKNTVTYLINLIMFDAVPPIFQKRATFFFVFFFFLSAKLVNYRHQLDWSVDQKVNNPQIII